MWRWPVWTLAVCKRDQGALGRSYGRDDGVNVWGRGRRAGASVEWESMEQAFLWHVLVSATPGSQLPGLWRRLWQTGLARAGTVPAGAHEPPCRPCAGNAHLSKQERDRVVWVDGVACMHRPHRVHAGPAAARAHGLADAVAGGAGPHADRSVPRRGARGPASMASASAADSGRCSQGLFRGLLAPVRGGPWDQGAGALCDRGYVVLTVRGPRSPAGGALVVGGDSLGMDGNRAKPTMAQVLWPAEEDGARASCLWGHLRHWSDEAAEAGEVHAAAYGPFRCVAVGDGWRRARARARAAGGGGGARWGAAAAAPDSGVRAFIVCVCCACVR